MVDCFDNSGHLSVGNRLNGPKPKGVGCGDKEGNAINIHDVNRQDDGCAVLHNNLGSRVACWIN